jgi:hypothetical protein
MTGDITLIIAISVGISLLAAVVGMRTTWLAGSFFTRSRVDVSTAHQPMAAAPAPTPARVRTPEERLADLKGLKDRGVIDDAEYERSRSAVLQQITKS